MVPLTLSLSLALLPALSYASEPLHIPLVRRAPAKHDLAYYAAAADHLRGKYHHNHHNKTQSKRASSADIAMINQVCLPQTWECMRC
jgi:hypothetical protein